MRVTDNLGDGSFSVYSEICFRSIWLYERGDEYKWDSDRLLVIRGGQITDFKPENDETDCSLYGPLPHEEAEGLPH